MISAETFIRLDDRLPGPISVLYRFALGVIWRVLGEDSGGDLEERLYAVEEAWGAAHGLEQCECGAWTQAPSPSTRGIGAACREVNCEALFSPRVRRVIYEKSMRRSGAVPESITLPVWEEE